MVQRVLMIMIMLVKAILQLFQQFHQLVVAEVVVKIQMVKMVALVVAEAVVEVMVIVQADQEILLQFLLLKEIMEVEILEVVTQPKAVVEAEPEQQDVMELDLFLLLADQPL